MQALKLLMLPVVVYLFRYEIGLIWRLFQYVILRNYSVDLPASRVWGSQILFFIGGLLLTAAAALSVLYLISGSIYPLKSSHDRYGIIGRLFWFMLGWRLPVVWVRDGRQQMGVIGAQDYSGGVVLVDPSSAILVENAKGEKRVHSGGVVFIRSDEKLAGQVSLRQQSRNLSNIKVQTSDGIELTTSASVTFTLGENPEVKKVTYAGHLPFGHEQKHLDLRVVKIKWDSSGKSGRIESIDDELDLVDKLEIHQFIMDYRRQGAMQVEGLARDDDKREFPPYVVDPDRIKAAAAATAYWANNEGFDQWWDVPIAVVTEKLRLLVATIKYDEFFMPGGAGVFPSVDRLPFEYEQTEFPLQKTIKPKFGNSIKSLGVLACQYIYRISGRNLENKLVISENNKDIRTSPVYTLKDSKPLRDLGIKINRASFGDLAPGPEIQAQRLAQWIYRWQQEVTEDEVAHRQVEARKLKDSVLSARYHNAFDELKIMLQKLEVTGGANQGLYANLLKVLNEYMQDKKQFGRPEDAVKLLEKLQEILVAHPR